MLGTFTNPCGGQQWRTAGDWTIEVAGEGYPLIRPDSGPSWTQMVTTWQNWESLFRAAAKRHGVPPSWLLSFATMETGLWSDDPTEQATIRSPAGAIGIMQIMPGTAEMYDRSPTAMTSPAENIDVGAALMRDLAERESWELPVIAARYNSGRRCDESGRFGNEWRLYAASNYPRKVMAWNNSAIAFMDVNTPKVGGQLLVGALVLAACGLYAYAIMRPEGFGGLPLPGFAR